MCRKSVVVVAEETHLAERKKLYRRRQQYHGNLYVPDNMETFEI